MLVEGLLQLAGFFGAYVGERGKGRAATGYRLRNPVPGADRIFHRADRPKLINARESDERVLNKPRGASQRTRDIRFSV